MDGWEKVEPPATLLSRTKQLFFKVAAWPAAVTRVDVRRGMFS